MIGTLFLAYLVWFTLSLIAVDLILMIDAHRRRTAFLKELKEELDGYL